MTGVDLRTATSLLTSNDVGELDEAGAAVWLDTREVPIEELTPFPGNAKRGDVDVIRASLRKNGQYRSLVVRNLPTGALVVLGGNHTLQALKAEGHETARCEIISCSDAAARRINVVDNRAADLGTYDSDDLSALLAQINEDSGDYDGTGYTADDVELITSAPADLDALAEEYGEEDEEDLWPTLKFRVSPNVRDDFYEHTRGETDEERFMHLLNRVRANS